MILVFDGQGNGITESNFAGKLLGRTREGKLLFGYARLPGVNCLEPILRAGRPAITKTSGGYTIDVEVQNFGQARSTPSTLQIELSEGEQFNAIASGMVPGLDPFKPTQVTLFCGKAFEDGASYHLKTILNPGTAKETSAIRQVNAEF